MKYEPTDDCTCLIDDGGAKVAMCAACEALDWCREDCGQLADEECNGRCAACATR